jgi:hypothetical protein
VRDEFNPGNLGGASRQYKIDQTPQSRQWDEAEPGPDTKAAAAAKQNFQTGIFSAGHRDSLRVLPAGMSQHIDQAAIW